MAVSTLTLNPSLDLAAEVDHVRPEDKLRTGPPSVDAGGGGINVARVLARLGTEVTAVYPAGGATGRLLADLLDQERVAAQPVPIEGETRTNITIAESVSDDQYRFVLPGPELSEDEWRACLEALLDLDADLVVASGSLPAGTPETVYVDVVERARERGVRVIVDTSGPALRAVAAARPFLVKPNLRELQQLIGREVEEHADVGAALRSCITEGIAEVIVLSLGAAGVMVATEDGVEHLPAPVVPIASKVGAGDSTVAGIAAGLVRELPLAQAVRLGLAAGAAAVTTPGTELAQRADIERLARELGVEGL